MTVPISYNFTDEAKRSRDANSSGVALRANRSSSGIDNVTWLMIAY